MSSSLPPSKVRSFFVAVFVAVPLVACKAELAMSAKSKPQETAPNTLSFEGVSADHAEVTVSWEEDAFAMRADSGLSIQIMNEGCTEWHEWGGSAKEKFCVNPRWLKVTMRNGTILTIDRDMSLPPYFDGKSK